ncbi:hypothetical protein GH5_01453 [Leishmania sp. Ghana 2012 LV757]|uniref:hypothetical protein n=1 Tax=Leishmania sp. Ghana 2012 LV757 TaxID=2803181 RepID=UPI001B79A90C|nr:hypothetical protein GH5_01453 [Leishmania sp. Ghana 2012 LV757]
MPENIRYRFFFKGKSYLIPKDYIDNEHPGGGEKIMPYVGHDMTAAFEDADHSLDAVELLEEWLEEEYALSLPSDSTAAPSPAQEEAKTAEPVTEALPLATEFTSAAPKPAPTVFTESMSTPPMGDSKPSKRKSLMPAVTAAASLAVVMASVALVFVRVTKRRC